MCGFAGVISWDERLRTSRDTLAEMSARVAHRGPDGEGIYISPDAEISASRPQIALAHRRLAILDPDPRANQPFTDAAGRWLVFNGEIYNFRELRAELSRCQPGYAWRTNCDTEVLLLAYDQWGENCVDHLNGMFAFAVWDEPRQALFLARDRMGQKPLYVACISDGPAGPIARGIPCNSESFRERGVSSPLLAVAFASEASALKPWKWFNDQIDDTALIDYLRWGYVSSSASIYQGAAQLAPGTTQTLTHVVTHDARYFSPSDGTPFGQSPSRGKNTSDAIRETRERLMQAVNRQLVSDVPLGCFLSGGVDSSIIAAAMAAASGGGQNVLTFSIGFDDARYDETAHADAVAKHLGTQHRRFIVRPDAAKDLPKLAAAFGEPFGDSSALPTHYLSRETREFVKVALSGDGGDELFGGYDRYRAMLFARRATMLTSRLPWKIISAPASRLAGGHPKSQLARAARFARSLALSPGKRYASYLRLMDDRLIVALLNEKSALSPRLSLLPDAIAAQIDSADGPIVPAVLAMDRFAYLPGDLLTKVDRASMLHALEVRSPFMDHELVNFAAGLSTDQLLKGGPKRMLREAFADDLPAWVFKRKKMGFAVPIGDWFRGELRPMLHDHLFASDSFAAGHFKKPVLQRLVQEHETFRHDHSQRLYALLMLELWFKTHKNLLLP